MTISGPCPPYTTMVRYVVAAYWSEPRRRRHNLFFIYFCVPLYIILVLLLPSPPRPLSPNSLICSIHQSNHNHDNSNNFIPSSSIDSSFPSSHLSDPPPTPSHPVPVLPPPSGGYQLGLREFPGSSVFRLPACASPASPGLRIGGGDGSCRVIWEFSEELGFALGRGG